jgi:pimeloyl-ACP methyl ester carboxylesterase
VPVIRTGGVTVDTTDDGVGPPVILLHSSACGNRQWRTLIGALQDRYRVLAPNLFGYGETPAWTADKPQRMEDQVSLVTALADWLGEPVRLIGHSFGGAVAMRTALHLNDESPGMRAALGLEPRVSALVLIEPNPFHLLVEHGRDEAAAEALILRDVVKTKGGAGDWETVGRHFADYWTGRGAFNSMKPERRDRFVEMVPPNFYEWDAVLSDETPVEAYTPLAARTLLVYDPKTKRPIREIAEIMIASLPGLHVEALSKGGHMAPLSAPDTVDPIVAGFLDRLAA